MTPDQYLIDLSVRRLHAAKNAHRIAKRMQPLQAEYEAATKKLADIIAEEDAHRARLAGNVMHMVAVARGESPDVPL